MGQSLKSTTKYETIIIDDKTIKPKCRKCGGKKFWRIRRERLRCVKCRYEFKFKLGNLNLKIREWKKLLKWFLRCQSINVIKEETKISEYKILKALNIVRKAMIKDVPKIFNETVEVDKTYLGGQKKNKNKKQLIKEKTLYGQSKKGFETTKQPVFAILSRSDKVFAKVVPDTEAKDLIPIIEKKVKKGNKICSDTWRAYTGLATKGYVHRIVNHGKKEYVKGKSHINGLEGFFGFLKRQLASRGRIRRERIPLYLAEYVWRYNNKDLIVQQQIEKLLNLVAKI